MSNLPGRSIFGARRAAVGACGAVAVLVAAGSAAADESRGYDVLADQVYIERDSGPLAADVFVPRGEGPFPAMLIVHGGAWAHGTKEQLRGAAEALAEDGYTAAAISYRLAPQHQFPAQLHDCQAAVRWLRAHAEDFKVDPARVGGYGYSAGGHLVALLGALGDDAAVGEADLADDAPSARLQVVVGGGAPCDFVSIDPDSARLAYWLGGTPGECPEAYRDASPASFVSADDPPMFFFHGTGDSLVSIDSPRRMVERLRQAGVSAELYEVAQANHLLAAVDRGALERAVAFVDRHLQPRPAAAPAADTPAAAPPDESPHGQ